MSVITMNSKEELRKMADDLEECKSILQLETYYKNNLAGKKIDPINKIILQDMMQRKLKHLEGHPSRWVSGPRPTSLTSEKRIKEPTQ